jgi:hypothetical protein
MTQTLARIDGAQQLARDPADLAPRFVVSLDDLEQQLHQLEQFKRRIMVEGVDFGTIPGTPKPTLLKPGAEKLALAFALAPSFVNVSKVEDWENGLFYYHEQCVLVSKRTGEAVAAADGSANSREPRYRWRRSERVCPGCGQPTIIKGKDEFGGGWLCWRNRGGCGLKFKDGDETVEGQRPGNVPNPEPFELTNTILKMAQKRALVAAVLIATGGSGIWTQDVEDMPSVSGDAPATVVEVAPREPEPKPAPKRKAASDMVLSADEPIWQKWLALVERANEFGIEVKPISPPIGKVMLQGIGSDLQLAIKVAKDKRAAEEASEQTQDQDAAF